MVVRQADALGMKLIKIGRLENRVSMTREIPVALVIGNHQYDIRCLGLDPLNQGDQANGEQKRLGFLHGRSCH